MTNRALIFDCFGVLYHGSLDELYRLTPVARHRELRDLAHASDYGLLTAEEFLDGTAELTGKSPAALSSLIATKHVRNQPVVEYLRSQKAECRIGILSNIGARQFETLFDKAEQAILFDAVVLSSDLGITKPQPDIYVYAADQLGISPDRCLMIDDVADNVYGAEAAGLMGHQYRSLTALKAAVEAFKEGKEDA